MTLRDSDDTQELLLFAENLALLVDTLCLHLINIAFMLALHEYTIIIYHNCERILSLL